MVSLILTRVGSLSSLVASSAKISDYQAKQALAKKILPRWLMIAAFAITTFAFSSGAWAQLSTPNPSPEAVSLYNYLQSIRGHSVLAGQQEQNGTAPDIGKGLDYFSNWIYQQTGQYPALIGYDWGNSNTPAVKQAAVTDAINWWKAGGIVEISHHIVYPGYTGTDYWNSGIEPTSGPFANGGSGLQNDSAFNLMVTNMSSTYYSALQAEWDSDVPYLQQLQSAHVPVLWRPYHEMNGNWFWWGNRADYAYLWQLEWNYFKSKGINNLIWVWSPWQTTNTSGSAGNSDCITGYYPGNSYVDILACDTYSTNYTYGLPYASYNYNQAYYNIWQAQAGGQGGKLIAIGESDALPTSATIASQPNWIWFNIWTTYIQSNNTISQLQQTYNSPNVITRSRVPNLGASNANGIPVISGASTTSTGSNSSLVANSCDGVINNWGSYQCFCMQNSGDTVTYALNAASQVSGLDMASGISPASQVKVEYLINGGWTTISSSAMVGGTPGSFIHTSLTTKTGVTAVRLTAVSTWIYIDEIKFDQ